MKSIATVDNATSAMAAAAAGATDAKQTNVSILQQSTSIVDVADFINEQQEDSAAVEKETTTTALLPNHHQDNLVNLTSASAGARVLFATDEWFAAADNLLRDDEPSFDPDAYCAQGKVMDGWESRRRREAGHDWCIIQLATTKAVSSAVLVGVEIDTAFFTGNHVPAISIQGADIRDCQVQQTMVSQFPNALQRLLFGGVQGTGNTPEQVARAEEACRVVEWKELLPKTPLNPGYEATRKHYFPLCCTDGSTITHLRVNYFPDGGVARLRLWGQRNTSSSSCDIPRPVPGPLYSPISTGERCTVVPHNDDDDAIMPSRQAYDYVEISCEDNGGRGLVCSNQHYGQPCNLIQACFGRDMGDGWETARHPERPHVLIKDPKTGLVDSPLSDWCILELGGVLNNGVARIILDTKHFRGNYPESVFVEGCYVEDAVSNEEWWHTATWFPLIDRVRMAPDSEHVFERSQNQIVNAAQPVSHVRLSIYPDGGVSRVRVYG